MKTFFILRSTVPYNTAEKDYYIIPLAFIPKLLKVIAKRKFIVKNKTLLTKNKNKT